jgi:hypothetical protein
VSSVSENLCTIEGHDMVCDGFHRFQSKVVVVNTKIANDKGVRMDRPTQEK